MEQDFSIDFMIRNNQKFISCDFFQFIDFFDQNYGGNMVS